MLYTEWLVWEYYIDDAPEPFGSVFLSRTPKIGDTIMLKWADGSDAYETVVRRIVHDRLELCCTTLAHMEAIKCSG